MNDIVCRSFFCFQLFIDNTAFLPLNSCRPDLLTRERTVDFDFFKRVRDRAREHRVPVYSVRDVPVRKGYDDDRSLFERCAHLFWFTTHEVTILDAKGVRHWGFRRPESVVAFYQKNQRITSIDAMPSCILNKLTAA